MIKHNKPVSHSENMFRLGYQKGYQEGVNQGKQSFGTYFEGTSIIIPSYNQKGLLLECIESIEAYTAPPYEIIVIDNGSEDGTTEELLGRGGTIRVTKNEQNLGFARAINIGLMMAKGNYIVLMNNDVLVTEGWLDQLLNCLSSNKEIGAVGPVTNYISGEQQIPVPYEDTRGMREFSIAFNKRDATKWKRCDRLVGFCILMPRSTFEDVGYLDEGYEIGNFEDDDWILRLRFQGKQMMIAGDTFVHHYGSVTMKGLGQQGFIQVNQRNEDFFTQKWGRGFELLANTELNRSDISANPRQSSLNSIPSHPISPSLRSIDFFPSHVFIKSWSGRIYWLANGVKHPVPDSIQVEHVDATRLSVIELLNLPTGTPYNPAIHQPSQQDLEGRFIYTADGHYYQIENAYLREFTSSYACQQWGILKQCIEMQIPDLPAGLPILPPLRLQSEDL